MIFQKKTALVFLSILGFTLCFSVTQAIARVVNNVNIRTRAAGYEIQIKFILPLRYVKHQPKSKGETLLIEMSPVSGLTLENSETLQQFGDRESLSWDRSIPVPLKEINYDDGSPDRPKLVFRFTRKVEFSIQSSGDLRTLIVFVKAKTEPEAKAKEEVVEKKELEPDLSRSKPSSADPELVKVMEEANKEMTAENYSRAIQLYTKILTRPESDLSQDAQEFLGLARERNKQLAHAKSEYEKYLKKYPEGSGANRVRQRLTGLLTAGDRPKEKLRRARVAGDPDKTVWDTQVFGSFSQFFSYDETDSDNSGGSRVNRKELTSDLDLNTRFRSDKYEIRSQFVGGYEEDLRSDGEESEIPINTFTLEARDIKRGFFGRFGRQFESTGGVLGRYDGAWLGYEVSPQVQVNGVFGFPVARTTAKPFDTEKHFYGLNLDLGTFAKYWDFNIYGINQEVDEIIDRQAVGGEARYFHPQRSFLTLMDYDVSYSELNLFIFSGDIVFPAKTRWHIALDYRKSPLLTTSNALQGQQGVDDISQLLNTFSEDEVRELARDRTAVSKSLIFSVTQDLTERFQVNGEFSVSNLSGTPASGGVEAAPSTGNEFFYSTQLIGSSLLKEGDITIFGLRYTDLQNVDSYSVDLNTRFPITRNLRINPRVRLDYRKNKNDDGDRTNIRPLVRLDYRFKKWLRFELEGGREWSNETIVGDSQKSSNYFFSLGARAFF
jgi:hypothetical protein